jgi:hypothetical protein
MILLERFMQVDIQLLALICGHLFGDFILQTDLLAERKMKYVKWLLWHVLLVSILTWILLGNLGAWWIAGAILILHLFVDSLKLLARKQASQERDVTVEDADYSCQKEARTEQKWQGKSDHRLLWLVIDQTLHILIIIALWLYISKSGSAAHLENHWVTLFGMNYTKGLLFLTGLAVGVWGIGVMLKYQMAEFADKLADKVKQGLPRGGKAIGILERLLVFMFVFAGKPEGIGFVIAAKSVFRIGEFTNKNDRDHAEYIMIGTLRSFTYALAIAFTTKWLIGQIR